MDQLALYDDADCGHYTLSELFMFSPFSVLDTRARDWQARKKMWLSLGIKSELGREENITSAPVRTSYMTGSCTHCAPGTSVFDPVLCEVMYKWFCTPGGKILDPFAGGSVRGIVASYLGYDYHGNDLRPEQIAANKVCPNKKCNLRNYKDDDHLRSSYVEQNAAWIDQVFN